MHRLSICLAHDIGNLRQCTSDIVRQIGSFLFRNAPPVAADWNDVGRRVGNLSREGQFCICGAYRERPTDGMSVTVITGGIE